MKVRQFDNKKDYQDVCKWWIAQGWPALPESILTTSGFIVEHEGQKLAATWIFKTNCPIYIMEWTVGNPECKWEDRSEAIQMVTNAACQWAKEDGAKQVFTMTKVERFINKLEENGFMKTDSGMTHLVRSL